MSLLLLKKREIQYQPKITKEKIILELEKPIYGSFYTIWDKWLRLARDKHLAIEVRIKEGIFNFTLQEYLKGAKRTERFYKNPNKPMVFYGRDF